MIEIKMGTQPTDESCGPTSLHAIYRYYGFNIALNEVIKSVERSPSGGTLAPLLGKHALLHGFKASIYVNNLGIFDPTWFSKTQITPREILLSKLHSQDKFKHSKGITAASKAFQEFLSLGGNIRFKTVDVALLKEYFNQNVPILTGLNSTYLYRTARELYTSDGHAFFDDLQGEATGHFVVLCGYDEKKRRIIVADPFRENPFSHDHYYKVSISRLVNAIMLGAATYDANLLVIKPKEEHLFKKK